MNQYDLEHALEQRLEEAQRRVDNMNSKREKLVAAAAACREPHSPYRFWSKKSEKRYDEISNQIDDLDADACVIKNSIDYANAEVK